MRIIFFIIILMVSVTTFAALPPHVQEQRDTLVMLNFVKKHPKVNKTFKRVDTKDYRVYYGGDCYIQFKRKYVLRPSGWVGPAEHLIFDSATCDYE